MSLGTEEAAFECQVRFKAAFLKKYPLMHAGKHGNIQNIKNNYVLTRKQYKKLHKCNAR